MRFGVLMLPVDPWTETVRRARRLEELGYDHLWTYDHLAWRRYRDQAWHAAIPWLTGLSAATSRIRLGTMVSTPNFRHPLTLAKEVMTLDHVSGGRITLGLGVGGRGFDATVLGTETLPKRQQVARFAEFVDVLDRLLRQPATSYRGTYYTIDEARMIPGCLQKPRLPFAIAAGGPRTLAVAARYADAWITYGDTAYRDTSAAGTEAVIRRQLEWLTLECEMIKRDPSEIRRIYLIGNTDERPLASVEAFTEFAGRYAGLGFTDLVFHHPRPDDAVWNEPEEIVDAVATQVLPRFR
jgi:alkanesulfonate monooxygenase SsuD/methylene tetrahydromethanopterin reductase-like flavin-dependent oxidoreductase (luciferase family)